VKNECRKLKAKNDDLKRDQFRGRGGDDEKEYTTVIAFDGEIFIICDENFVNFTSQDSTWVIDSATSFHSFLDVTCSLFYKRGDYGVVKMRNNEICKFFKIRDVCGD
jgi:hypothetical protein